MDKPKEDKMMLKLYRNTGESIRIYNELTQQERIIKLVSHNHPTCVLQIDGEMQIKKIPEQVEIDVDDCSINILSIDRGVNFGIIAPSHVRLNRV
ncbi:hypothetical protein NVP1029O_09 [Vibrio phage 1.029.O._10N.261.55.A7]|nr:hypothetical protein NVP1029O_09 [Vibrio phage 1.029.O._10N.261.55.A7]